MPALFQGEIIRVYNETGVAIAANSQLAVSGYNTQARMPTVVLAQANNTNNRADFFLPAALPNIRGGLAYRSWLQENVSTVGRALRDPVFLSNTVAGGVVYARPTGATADSQEIGVVVTAGVAAGRIWWTYGAGGVRGLAPDSIDDSRLLSKPHRDIGQSGVGYIRFTGAVADGDQVGINARIYEFDTAVPPGAVNAGSIRVDVSAGAGAAAAAAALTAAINADAGRAVNAVVVGGNAVAVTAIVVTAAGNYALTNPVDLNGTIGLSAAAMTGAAPPTPQRRLSRSYVLTATDVTALAAGLGTNEIVIGAFASATQPQIHQMIGWLSLGGNRWEAQSMDTASVQIIQANASFWVMVYREPGPGALLAAGDRLAFDLIVSD